MKISLSPIGYDNRDVSPLAALELARNGDVLTVNGQSLDMSVIPAGATLPNAAQATDCPYFAGAIERDDDGVLALTLTLPTGPTASHEARFPANIVDPPNGPILLPETGWPIPDTRTEVDEDGN